MVVESEDTSVTQSSEFQLVERSRRPVAFMRDASVKLLCSLGLGAVGGLSYIGSHQRRNCLEWPQTGKLFKFRSF